MGYFIIIVFTTFLGNPPELLPIAFKSNKDCIRYLTNTVKENYNFVNIKESNNINYLTNETYNKFAVCKKLEYPSLQTKLIVK